MRFYFSPISLLVNLFLCYSINTMKNDVVSLNSTKGKYPIVFSMNSDSIFFDNNELKAIRKYFKQKKFELISDEQVKLLVQGKITEIFEPYVKKGEIEQNKRELTEKILNISSIAKKLSYTVYGHQKASIDSLLIETYFIPGNKSQRKLIKKTYYNSDKKSSIIFINSILDSCIASKFLE